MVSTRSNAGSPVDVDSINLVSPWQMLAQVGRALADMECAAFPSAGMEKLAAADLGVVMCFWQVIPSKLPAAERVIDRVRRLGRVMGCSERELNKVEVALREALRNAIRHGNGGDPKKKVAVCCVCAEDQGMLLVVQDSGAGFDPGRVPDPIKGNKLYAAHGRGIHIMRRLMDEVRFEKGGRRVMMKKAAVRTNGGSRPI